MVHRVSGDIRAVDGKHAARNGDRHLGIGVQAEKRQYIATSNTQPANNKPSDQQPLPEGQLFPFLALFFHLYTCVIFQLGKAGVDSAQLVLIADGALGNLSHLLVLIA